MRALIIDDSRAMRTILGGILRTIGFEVMHAANGEEGLQQLDAAGAIDLAVVDWNMPVMDGLQFLRSVRSRAEFDAVRLMMVTTETDVGRMSEAMREGANEYVMKPFNRDVIVRKLLLMGLEPQRA